MRCGVIGEVGCSWPLAASERRSLQAAALAQKETGVGVTSQSVVWRYMYLMCGDCHVCMKHLETKNSSVSLTQWRYMYLMCRNRHVCLKKADNS